MIPIVHMIKPYQKQTRYKQTSNQSNITQETKTTRTKKEEELTRIQRRGKSKREKTERWGREERMVEGFIYRTAKPAITTQCRFLLLLS